MAGILNSKHRIMDVLITNNGRRQIADGTFKIEFASFSDHGMFYRDDGTGAADDASDRLMFEAYASNTDVIIPEINSQNAISMDTSSGKNIVNSAVITSASDSWTTQTGATFLSGAVDIYSSSNEVIQTAIDNFDRLQIIGTKNRRVLNEYFQLSRNVITFNAPSTNKRNLVNLPTIWGSETTNSQPQFKYMAPVYEHNNTPYPMATYSKINYEAPKGLSQLKTELELNSESKTIEIQSSEETTNLLMQCFETKDNEIKKLAIVDYGSYFDSSGKFLGAVFHLGKVFRDNSNNPKFVRFFSLLFEP